MPLTIRKRGKYWYARGTVPAKKADGSIGRVRIEESTRTSSKTKAREIAADLERHYHNLAYGKVVKTGPTFAQAALIYLETQGRGDYFIERLLRHFGNTPITAIDQATAQEACRVLYPLCSPSTHQRAVFTPLKAIGVTGLTGPKIPKVEIKIPDDEWIDAVLAVSPPRLGALILFITLTGRRVGEALALKKGAINDGWVTIPKTKTGKAVHVKVPDLVTNYLNAPPPKGYTGGDRSEHLFGYHSLAAAHVALKKACAKAGVPRYGFHAIGRHSFASRTLKAGKSIKWVKEAGGWESMKSLERYLHLEQSEVMAEADRLGQEWGKNRSAPPKDLKKQRAK